jgi:hypothetical protein
LVVSCKVLPIIDAAILASKSPDSLVPGAELPVGEEAVAGAVSALSAEVADAVPAGVSDAAEEDDPEESFGSLPFPEGAPSVAVAVTSLRWLFSSLSEMGRGGVGAFRLVTVVPVPGSRVTPCAGRARLAVCTTPWITATPVMLPW